MYCVSAPDTTLAALTHDALALRHVMHAVCLHQDGAAILAAADQSMASGALLGA